MSATVVTTLEDQWHPVQADLWVPPGGQATASVASRHDLRHMVFAQFRQVREAEIWKRAARHA